jgi:hypothetical protein
MDYFGPVEKTLRFLGHLIELYVVCAIPVRPAIGCSYPLELQVWHQMPWISSRMGWMYFLIEWLEGGGEMALLATTPLRWDPSILARATGSKISDVNSYVVELLPLLQSASVIECDRMFRRDIFRNRMLVSTRLYWLVATLNLDMLDSRL